MLKWLHFIPAKRSHSSYLRPRYMHHIPVLAVVVVLVVALVHHNKDKTIQCFFETDSSLFQALVTTELEGGDRQRAMKRLRVPPLGAAQVAH